MAIFIQSVYLILRNFQLVILSFLLLCTYICTSMRNVDLTMLGNVYVRVCSSCLLPPDTSLTSHALLHALSTVRNFWGINGLLFQLDISRSVRDEIRTSPSYSSEDEKRMASLQYSLQTLPGMSWRRIAGVLWFMEEHAALETVRQYLPHKPGDYITCTNLFLVTKWHSVVVHK